jgi:hypothetical protein
MSRAGKLIFFELNSVPTQNLKTQEKRIDIEEKFRKFVLPSGISYH